MNFYCKKCNHLLVSNLKEAKKSEVIYTDEYDLIPKGKYITNDKIWNFVDLDIEYLLNNKSINLKNHKDSKRLQGCCGPSGLDGFNQICPNCSAELGVLVSDCFTPIFLGLDKNKVSNEPLWK